MIYLDLQEGDADPKGQRPHLDAVARDGRTGHLALRADTGNLVELSAFAQLLGIHKVEG